MGLRGDWVGNALTNKLLRVGIHHCPCAWKDDCSGLQLLPSSWNQLAVGASRNRHQTGNRWRDAQWSNHRACTTPTMQQRCVGWDALEALEAILRTAAAAAFGGGSGWCHHGWSPVCQVEVRQVTSSLGGAQVGARPLLAALQLPQRGGFGAHSPGSCGG